MAKIIDLVEDKIVITPECLCISPFSELWNADKTKAKSVAINQIKYVWFYTDYASPYFQQPELTRSKMIITDVVKDKDFKVTSDILACINKYKELNYTPAIKMLEAANVLTGKMEAYFKEVDLATVDVKKVTEIFSNMPKYIESLKSAEKKCMEELSDGIKVRGNAKLGLFE